MLALMIMMLIGSSIMTFAFKLVYKAFCLAISGMNFGVQVAAKLMFLVPVVAAIVYCARLLTAGFIV